MNWPANAQRNLEALKRILASMVAMAKWVELSDAGVPTLPRFLHRRIVRLLGPAEAIARRLIIVAARGLVVTLPPPRKPRPKPKTSFAKNGKGTGIILPRGMTMLPPPPPPSRRENPPVAVPLPRFAGEDQPARSSATSDLPPFTGEGDHAQRGEGGGVAKHVRKLCLPLFDPIRRPFRLRRHNVPAHLAPRISTPGIGQRFALPPPHSPDDPVSALRLALRLKALGAALDDLPRHALRFARWKARVAAAEHNGNQVQRCARRTRALRRGKPPGCRLLRWDPTARRGKHIRDIDEVLAQAHDMALFALEQPDTS